MDHRIVTSILREDVVFTNPTRRIFAATLGAGSWNWMVGSLRMMRLRHGSAVSAEKFGSIWFQGPSLVEQLEVLAECGEHDGPTSLRCGVIK